MNLITRLWFGRIALLAIGWAATVTGVLAQVPTTLTVSSTAMTFQYQISATTLPAVQTFQVTSVPVGSGFTVTVAGAPFNGAWLLVSASSGVAPSAIKVQVNPTGLPSGSYSGTITITGTTGPAPP